MTKKVSKEEKAIEVIAKTIDKLEKYLEEIPESDEKKSIKGWYAQKRATHEIKKVLHEIDRYEKFEDKELEKINNSYEPNELSREDIDYISNYFTTNHL